jgi:DinB superfamily
MTTSTIDDFLIRHSPAEPQPVASALLRARDSLRSALADLATVPDSAMEKPWPWRGGEADVRYGFYRQAEALEEARAGVARALGRQAHSDEPPARALAAPATAARWELHGLLAGLADSELDRDPGNGEWTVRQTLAHIVSGQRAYGWFTAWWLARRDAPDDDFPARVPEDVGNQLPAEEGEGIGTVEEIGRRLDDIVDLSCGALGGLDDDALAARARWSGMAVDVRFRLVRWASHIREHTIQVEKTLGYLDRPTTEVEYLLRLIGAAYGRLEEELFMRPETDGGMAESLAIAESVAAGAAQDAKSVRAAAS